MDFGTEIEESTQTWNCSATGVTGQPGSPPRGFPALACTPNLSRRVVTGGAVQGGSQQAAKSDRDALLVARMSNRVTNHPVCSISQDWIARVVAFLSLHQGRLGSKLSEEKHCHVLDCVEYV